MDQPESRETTFCAEWARQVLNVYFVTKYAFSNSLAAHKPFYKVLEPLKCWTLTWNCFDLFSPSQQHMDCIWERILHNIGQCPKGEGSAANQINFTSLVGEYDHYDPLTMKQSSRGLLISIQFNLI